MTLKSRNSVRINHIFVGLFLSVFSMIFMINFFLKKVLKWVYKRMGELFLLATFEGCAGSLPFTLLHATII